MRGKTREGKRKGREESDGKRKEREDMRGEGKNYGQGKVAS
jgi:hypothetical protein